MRQMFRPSQGARDREEDGHLLYIPPPPRSSSRSRGPGPGAPPGRGWKRLIVAADGEFGVVLSYLRRYSLIVFKS